MRRSRRDGRDCSRGGLEIVGSRGERIASPPSKSFRESRCGYDSGGRAGGGGGGLRRGIRRSGGRERGQSTLSGVGGLGGGGGRRRLATWADWGEAGARTGGGGGTLAVDADTPFLIE
jgi:hypothetical protein